MDSTNIETGNTDIGETTETGITETGKTEAETDEQKSLGCTDVGESTDSASSESSNPDSDISPHPPRKQTLVTEPKEVGQIWVMQSRENEGAPGEAIEGHSVLGVLIDDISYLGFRITGDDSDEGADYRLFCADKDGDLVDKGLIWKITVAPAKKVVKSPTAKVTAAPINSTDRPVTTLYIRILVGSAVVINDENGEAAVSSDKVPEFESAEEKTARIEKAVDKITKLLALATSSNEHESALASEHAYRMMSEHRLELGRNGKISPADSGTKDECDSSKKPRLLVKSKYDYYVATQKKAVSRATPGKGMMSSKVPAFEVRRRVIVLDNLELETGRETEQSCSGDTSASADTTATVVAEPKMYDSSASMKPAQTADTDQTEGAKTSDTFKTPEAFGVETDDESLEKIKNTFKWSAER